MLKRKLSENSGRSTLEMIGVLTIMAILTIGGIAGYSKAMPKYKMSKMAEQTSLIITNIRAAYAEKDDYRGLDTAAAINMGAIVKEMTGTPSGTNELAAYNPFGGRIFLAPAEDNKSVFITIAGLPATACVFLASGDWGSRIGNGIASVATLAQTEQFAVSERLTANIGTAEDGTLPLTVAIATHGCSGIESNNAVVIEYQ